MDMLEAQSDYLENLATLKIELTEDGLQEKRNNKQYRIYNFLRSLELKTKGNLLSLEHFEQNINHFCNLENLTIKIAEIAPSVNLQQIINVASLEKLKNYYLGILKPTKQIHYEYIKNFALPSNIEKVKIVMLGSTEWDLFMQDNSTNLDLYANHLKVWQDAANLKDLHLVLEANPDLQNNWSDQLALALQSKQNLRRLGVDFRVIGVEEDDSNYLQKVCNEANLMEFYDFMRNYFKMVPYLSSLNLRYPIISLMNIHNYQDEIENLKSITLKGRIFGSRNIYHLFDLMKQKAIEMNLSQIMIENNDSMNDLVDTIPMMARKLSGSLAFKLDDEVNQDIATEAITKILKKTKYKTGLKLSFCLKDIKKPSLQKIGKLAFNLKKFIKLEIRSSKYLFVVGQDDEMYHILNIDIESESITDTSEDEL